MRQNVFPPTVNGVWCNNFISLQFWFTCFNSALICRDSHLMFIFHPLTNICHGVRGMVSMSVQPPVRVRPHTRRQLPFCVFTSTSSRKASQPVKDTAEGFSHWPQRTLVDLQLWGQVHLTPNISFSPHGIFNEAYFDIVYTVHLWSIKISLVEILTAYPHNTQLEKAGTPCLVPTTLPVSWGMLHQ
jgi:hypothetical protein